MPLFIDSHEDLACNMLVFNRDYRRAVEETRRLEAGTDVPSLCGTAVLGWPEYQKAQTAVIFGTLFLFSAKATTERFHAAAYKTPSDAAVLFQQEIDCYQQLAENNPEMFRLIRTRHDLAAVMEGWQSSPADYPEQTHPTGLVILMEGAEGISEPKAMQHWWEQGVRIAGPVWGGGRFCGSGTKPGGFTTEGKELLHVMSQIGMALDLSHMSTQATLYALDHFEGHILATHANVRRLLPDVVGERQFTDETIQALIERDGVMGVVPFNFFLDPAWKKGDSRETITVDHLINHIDAICQMAGNAHHAAIGTDFEGGFGYPDIPFEFNDISDIQLVSTRLSDRGYSPEDIDAIFFGNWQRMLERILPTHE